MGRVKVFRVALLLTVSLCLIAAVACQKNRDINLGGVSQAAASVVTSPLSVTPIAPLEQVDVQIAVTSDLHIRESGGDINRIGIEQLYYSTEIASAFGEEIFESGPDAVVICGDLTNSGRLEQHTRVLETLSPFREQGVSLLVLPGNHDLSSLSREEFVEMYADYGYNNALSRDTSSCSYMYEIGEKTWALMLDTNLHSESDWFEGELADSTLAWVEQELRLAQSQGITVISFSHHNIVGLFGESSISSIIGSDSLLALYEKYGVKLNVSGHRHGYQVSVYEGETSGVCEIIEPMLAEYPNTYGWLSIDASSGQINHEIKTLDVNSWALSHNVNDEALLEFTDHSKEWTGQRLERTIESIVNALDLEEVEAKHVEDFLIELNLATSEGNLSEAREQLLASEGYRLWNEYGTNSNFYFWFDLMLNQEVIYEGDLSIS